MSTQPPAAAGTGVGAKLSIGAGLAGLAAGLLIGVLRVSAEGVDCGAPFGGIDRFRDTYACIDALADQRNLAIIVLVAGALILGAGYIARQSSAPAQSPPAPAATPTPAASAAPSAPSADDGQHAGSEWGWVAALVVLVVVAIAIGVST